MSTVSLALSLPPGELAPNARPNRWSKAKAIAAYKQEAWVIAKQSQRKLAAPVVMDLTFTYATQRKRDIDNCVASFKAAQDGFVAAGLIPADDSASLSLGRVSIVMGRPAGVLATLTEAEG